MEDQQTDNNQNSSGKTNKWLIAALVVLVIGIAGLVFWALSIKTEVKELQAEKELVKWRLERELDSIVIEHIRIKEDYGELSDSLAGMDSLFQANADEIKSLLNYKWEYYKVQKKLTSLQDIAQGYVRKMDSIVTVNETLTVENVQMKEEIKIGQRQYRDLEKVTGNLEEKVEEASVLQVYNLRAIPAHVKGSGKEVPSDKIKRVKRVTVCFTVSENKIIEPGDRTIYIRIAQPDKEILIIGRGEKYVFEYNGESLQYSMKKDIDYQNEAFDLCVKYGIRTTQELLPGIYHVDLFVGDNTIGHTTFELR